MITLMGVWRGAFTTAIESQVLPHAQDNGKFIKAHQKRYFFGRIERSGYSCVKSHESRGHKKRAGFIIRPFDQEHIPQVFSEWAGNSEYQTCGFTAVSPPHKRNPEGPAARSNADTDIVLEI
jgi:hypothetical protein